MYAPVQASLRRTVVHASAIRMFGLRLPEGTGSPLTLDKERPRDYIANQYLSRSPHPIAGYSLFRRVVKLYAVAVG